MQTVVIMSCICHVFVMYLQLLRSSFLYIASSCCLVFFNLEVLPVSIYCRAALVKNSLSFVYVGISYFLRIVLLDVRFVVDRIFCLFVFYFLYFEYVSPLPFGLKDSDDESAVLFLRNTCM